MGTRLRVLGSRHRKCLTRLAAGIEHRIVYTCRQRFAAWSIRAVALLTSAASLRTSVAQIDATYGHLVPDSEEYLRGLLGGYDEPVATAR
jgi:hypothetical protein